MRSRYSSLPESVANQDGILSQERGASIPTPSHNGRVSVVEGHQGSGIKRTPSPIASHPCGTWKPRCGLARVDKLSIRASQPPVRTAQSRSRTGRLKKRTPAAERQRESITCWIGPRKRRYPPRKGADVDLVNHRKNEAKRANQRTSEMLVTDDANGPEGRTDWQGVTWRQAERAVRNLRQRLFRAAQRGDNDDALLRRPRDLLEPYALRGARTVLRGGRCSNVPPLPE
jgi:hypothetical protein